MKLHRQQQQAAERQQYLQPQADLPPPPPELMAQSMKSDGVETNLKCDGSLASSGYGSQNPITVGEESGTTSSGQVGSSQLDGEGRICIPISSDEFRMELESMIHTMNNNNHTTTSHFRSPPQSSRQRHSDINPPTILRSSFATTNSPNNHNFNQNRNTHSFDYSSETHTKNYSTMGTVRNDNISSSSSTLPRRHSYATSPNDFMLRLKMAKKRDFV